MMNFVTLSGVYENARQVRNMLHRPDLAKQLRIIADDPRQVVELKQALDNLDSHLRVMGFTEVEFKQGA